MSEREIKNKLKDGVSRTPDLPVSPADRAHLNHHRPAVLWFTGLSGAGKSTISGVVEQKLNRRSIHTMMLDGDHLRQGLCKDLGFSPQDRVENIRRIGEVARLMADAGLIAICAFISPFRSDRAEVRRLFKPGEFIEIFVDTPIETCIRRDPKGLYKRALAGDVKNFTGIDQPYEAPINAEIVLEAGKFDADTLADKVIAHLAANNIIKACR